MGSDARFRQLNIRIYSRGFLMTCHSTPACIVLLIAAAIVGHQPLCTQQREQRPSARVNEEIKNALTSGEI